MDLLLRSLANKNQKKPPPSFPVKIITFIYTDNSNGLLSLAHAACSTGLSGHLSQVFGDPTVKFVALLRIREILKFSDLQISTFFNESEDDE